MMYRSKFTELKNTKRRIHGFSLIELMVVMAIIGTLLTLTGGLAFKNVEQQGRIIELEKVQQLFRRLSYQAYYSGYKINVKLRDNRFIVFSNDETHVVKFEHITFEPLDYQVNTKAFIEPGYYKVVWNEQSHEYFIKPMFKLYEE